MGRKSPRRSRVLIAGGGVAGLEAALALRDLAGDRLDIELCSPRGEFVYRPFAIGKRDGPSVLRYDLGALAEWIGVSFRLGGIVSVDPQARVATAREGESIPFDQMLVASGARMVRSVPGSIVFWGAVDEGRVETVVRRLRAGILRDVVFAVPEGPSWVLPAYELALFAAGVLARSGVEDARVTLVTPDRAPLQGLGAAERERMAQLLDERRVEVVTGNRPVEFDGRWLWLAGGDSIEAGAVVSLPRLEGRHVDGLVADTDGFLPVDEEGRTADAGGSVFAAGDVTAGSVKGAGNATRAADVAAAALAVAAGCEVQSSSIEPAAELDRVEQDGKVPGHYLAPFLAALAAAGRPAFTTR